MELNNNKIKYSFCYIIKDRTNYTNIYNGKVYDIKNFYNSVKSICDATVSDFEVVVMDFMSTDTDYKWLNDLGVDNKVITIKEEFFNKGMGLNIAPSHCSGEYIFFIDSDMLISTELMVQCDELLETKPAFFPICYSYTTPENNIGKFRPTGFGNVIIEKKFYMDMKLTWNERESWGLEDSDFYHSISKYAHRCNGVKFYHQWHSNDDSFKLKNWKYKNRRYDGRNT